MILIVDDDADVRATIRHSLELLSYASREAEDGPTALALMREMRPQIVILDHKMPGMSGAEVAAEITRIYPALPIIFASGHAEDPELLMMASQGTAVLSKPFSLGTLAELIAQLTNKA